MTIVSKNHVTAHRRIQAATSLMDLAVWNRKHREGWRTAQSNYSQHQHVPVPPPVNVPANSKEPTHFYQAKDPDTWGLIQSLLTDGMSIDMIAEVMHDHPEVRKYWRNAITKRLDTGELTT